MSSSLAFASFQLCLPAPAKQQANVFFAVLNIILKRSVDDDFLRAKPFLLNTNSNLSHHDEVRVSFVFLFAHPLWTVRFFESNRMVVFAVANSSSKIRFPLLMHSQDIVCASLLHASHFKPARGRASSSGGRRTKPSPNKGRCPDRCYRRSRPHVICPHPSATSTSVRSFGWVSLSAASSPPTSASYVISVRHLVGLGEKMSGR